MSIIKKTNVQVWTLQQNNSLYSYFPIFICPQDTSVSSSMEKQVVVVGHDGLDHVLIAHSGTGSTLLSY